MLSDGLVEIHTNVGVQRAGAVRAPRGSAPLRVGWGRPTIVGIEPPFGPQDGGTTVTIVGNFFSDETVTQRLRKVVLTHSGDGGEARECCATARLSETQMSCRLPRVSCLSSNPTKPCPQPGLSFANQTVIYAIQPDVKGYDGSVPANELDDFVQFEGTWELDDEDVYGGLYVDTANRIDGQQYILNTPISQATQKCCPVCATPGSASCWFTITQATTDSGSPRPGVYTVKVPEFMRPSGQAGPCDASTNFVNTSLTMGIELSTDPRGFTPTPPLSITSCIDMTGPCAQLPRASIRETCKQLMWSTGSISATLPVGQTVEVYTWVADGVCDRRMKCVAGPCLWTSLVNTSEDGQPKLQRRASSAQIGLEVAYPNPGFDPAGFLAAVRGGAADEHADSVRPAAITGAGGVAVQRAAPIHPGHHVCGPRGVSAPARFAVCAGRRLLSLHSLLLDHLHRLGGTRHAGLGSDSAGFPVRLGKQPNGRSQAANAGLSLTFLAHFRNVVVVWSHWHLFLS